MDADWPKPWNHVGRQLKKAIGRDFQQLLELCEEEGSLTERQSKRLDKALVLMKAGFKMAKKAVKRPAHEKKTSGNPPQGVTLGVGDHCVQSPDRHRRVARRW